MRRAVAGHFEGKKIGIGRDGCKKQIYVGIAISRANRQEQKEARSKEGAGMMPIAPACVPAALPSRAQNKVLESWTHRSIGRSLYRQSALDSLHVEHGRSPSHLLFLCLQKSQARSAPRDDEKICQSKVKVGCTSYSRKERCCRDEKSRGVDRIGRGVDKNEARQGP